LDRDGAPHSSSGRAVAGKHTRKGLCQDQSAMGCLGGQENSSMVAVAGCEVPREEARIEEATAGGVVCLPGRRGPATASEPRGGQGGGRVSAPVARGHRCHRAGDDQQRTMVAAAGGEVPREEARKEVATTGGVVCLPLGCPRPRLNVVATGRQHRGRRTQHGIGVAAEEGRPAKGSHSSSTAGITRPQTARQW